MHRNLFHEDKMPKGNNERKFIKLPGIIDRSYHKFEIMTTFGNMTHVTSIDGNNSTFNIDFKRLFNGNR